jgi:hypothetical protein
MHILIQIDGMDEDRWPKIAWNIKPTEKPRKCCKDDFEASTRITF